MTFEWTTPILIAVAVCLICVAGFFLLLRVRWFSRWKKGFRITLIVALAGSAILSAILTAVSGYEASKRLLEGQVVKQLENVGGILEAEVEQDVRRAIDEIDELPGLLRDMDWGDTAPVEATLAQVLQINARFLQLRLIDPERTAVAAVGRGGALEPVDAMVKDSLLQDQAYISNPYWSEVFDTFAITLGVPVHTGEGLLRGVVLARYDFDGGLTPLMASTRFGESGYTVIVSNAGQVIAHPDPARIQDDLSDYPAVQAGLKGESGSLVANNKAGAERLFFYRPLASPAKIDPEAMVILTEMDVDEAVRPLLELREEFLVALLILGLVAALAAIRLSQSIKRPLAEVVTLAHRVESGDFTARFDLTGRDEFGRLSGALNGMVRGLLERDRVKEIFGRYVTTQVSEEVLKGNLKLGGASRRVTILFSDIRGFTAMSESMTPEQVVEFLNEYFSEMVDAVFEEGGVLDKFLGDGMLAVFGSLDEAADHPARAVRAGLKMTAALDGINRRRAEEGKPPIAIGIGIHTAEVVVGNIGSKKRLEYTVIGDGVNTCSRVQALNKQFGTTLLITEDTHREVADEFECRLMPEAAIRGKSQAIRFYEVLHRRV